MIFIKIVLSILIQEDRTDKNHTRFNTNLQCGVVPMAPEFEVLQNKILTRFMLNQHQNRVSNFADLTKRNWTLYINEWICSLGRGTGPCSGWWQTLSWQVGSITREKQNRMFHSSSCSEELLDSKQVQPVYEEWWYHNDFPSMGISKINWPRAFRLRGRGPVDSAARRAPWEFFEVFSCEGCASSEGTKRAPSVQSYL